MVIRDLEHLETLSESKEATGIFGGARTFTFSKSFSTPFFTTNRTYAFASGSNIAIANAMSGSTYAAGPAGVFSTSGGNGFAFGA
jgi:hypothetical protein